ncbi:MAG: hypothetical protein JO347_07270 [Candidatus Eremiobacteraeota bacterium]|nr:hypothetical protein [Candidatus Eremiobacteraeota bacterium]
MLGIAGSTSAYLEMITAMRAMVGLLKIQARKAAEVGMKLLTEKPRLGNR